MANTVGWFDRIMRMHDHCVRCSAGLERLDVSASARNLAGTLYHLRGVSSCVRLVVRGVHPITVQAWAQLGAVAIPAVLRTPTAQLYVALISAAILCAYTVIVQVSAAQQLMPAFGAPDRHGAPWAPIRSPPTAQHQQPEYVHPGTEALAAPPTDDAALPSEVTGDSSSPVQPSAFLEGGSAQADSTAAARDAVPHTPTPEATFSPIPIVTGVWPAPPARTQAITSATQPVEVPAWVQAATAEAVTAPPAAAPAPQLIPQAVPQPEPQEASAPPGAAPLTPADRPNAEDTAELLEDLAALQGRDALREAMRRPSLPVAAPAALMALAADTVTPGWQNSQLAAAAARAGIAAADSLASAATPFVPLFAVEPGPVVFQVRSSLVHLSNCAWARLARSRCDAAALVCRRRLCGASSTPCRRWSP